MLLYEIWKNITEDNDTTQNELNAKLYSTVDNISIYAAVDSEKKLHLIISDIGNLDFDELKVKGLLIRKNKWFIDDENLKCFIDVFCDISITDKHITPFLTFCLDLISSIEKNTNQLYQIIRRVFFKWKYFWDNISVNDFSESWLKGLFGELLVLKTIINEIDERAILTWQGPLGKDIDFQGFNCGIEVKTTSTRPSIITINNIKQLDNSNFDLLYLTIVTLNDDKNGISINNIVDDIVQKLELHDQDLVDLFSERLISSGYYLYDKKEYDDYLYSVNSIEWYIIDDLFPSLTYSKLKDILDYRIKNIKYQLEILDLKKSNTIDNDVNHFLKKLVGCGL